MNVWVLLAVPQPPADSVSAYRSLSPIHLPCFLFIPADCAAASLNPALFQNSTDNTR
jgi:hypothetical protein